VSARRYRKVRRIADGGSAEIWEAEDASGARVAIKRALPSLEGDPTVARMLADEAHIGARLVHPHVVRVLDHGTWEGAAYLVMEHVAGLDAARAIRLREHEVSPFPEELALHVAACAADALAYAHAARDDAGRALGIVHRDVCPANLLLGWDGSVRLGDFGIARAADRAERTASGWVKGRAAYLAPEQLLGHEIGPPADVFALGATLHALLAQEPPAAGPAELARRVKGEPPAIARWIRDEVATLIALCMHVDAARRPTGAQAARAARGLAELDEAAGNAALARDLAPLRARIEQRGALDDLLGLTGVGEEIELA
jgi:serine/threonine-protein kinase